MGTGVRRPQVRVALGTGLALLVALASGAVMAAAAGAVVLFGLLAAWSSRAAARLRPAEILRTE